MLPDIYIPKHLKLINNSKGLAVVANRLIKEREIVCELFFSSITSVPIDSASVQVEENTFLNNGLHTIDDYFNHDCEPTTRINFAKYNFEAVRDIRKGKEITWNYLTTEYDLGEESFDCKCGSENCYGKIGGFKFLNEKQKQALRQCLSPFLRMKINLQNLYKQPLFSSPCL